MKRKTTFLVLAALLLLASVALAQGDYDLSWWTVDGGGGTSSGGGYTISGTSGQPDAGALSGGGYTLVSGFWGGTAAVVETPTATPTPTATRTPSPTVTKTPSPTIPTATATPTSTGTLMWRFYLPLVLRNYTDSR